MSITYLRLGLRIHDEHGSSFAEKGYGCARDAIGGLRWWGVYRARELEACKGEGKPE